MHSGSREWWLWELGKGDASSEQYHTQVTVGMAFLEAGIELGQKRKNSKDAIWGLWLLG